MNLTKNSSESDLQKEWQELLSQFRMWCKRGMVSVIDEYANKLWVFLNENREFVSDEEFQLAHDVLDAVIKKIWGAPGQEEAFKKLQGIRLSSQTSDLIRGLPSA